MAKLRKKHHIYTFVIGKRMVKTLFVITLSLILGFFGSYAVSRFGEKRYTSLLKYSSSKVLKRKSEMPSAKKISADAILRKGWPVFEPSENVISVFNPKGADQFDVTEFEEIKIETEPKKGSEAPYEKTIVSHNLDISNATDYKIDANLLFQAPIQYNVSSKEPTVLVMHSHACETYTGENGLGLGDAGTYRTTDANKNVVKIGEILAQELNERGIYTIHDKTLCDYPSYNLAYKTAMGLNDWYLNRYPSISFIFDIHRDAIADNDGNAVKLVTDINGETLAQAMIVCGTDKLGLEHPHWKDNLTLALKIQKATQELYPTLMRPVNLREERFNMHQTKGSLIFEIGTHGNSMEEAERCVRYLADGICKVLK